MKKLFLTLCAGLVALAANAASSQLWLVGEPVGSWGTNNGRAMTQSSSGVFTIDVSFDGNKYFAFVDIQTNNDWNTFNSHRYGPSGNGSIPSTDGKPNSMVYGQDRSWQLPSGNYHFVVDTNPTNATLTVTSDSGIVYPELYVMGDQPGWGPNATYKFENNEGVYTLSLGSIEFSGQFKLATDGWSYSYGSNSGNTTYAQGPIELGKGYKLYNNQGSGNLTTDGKTWKNAVFTFDYDTETLTVTGATSDNEYDTVYIVGEVFENENWDANIENFPLTQTSTGVFEGTFTPTKQDSYFKLRAGNLLYGVTAASAEPIVSGQATTAYKNADQSFYITNGTYQVKFELEENADSGTLTVTGSADYPTTMYILGANINDAENWGDGEAMTSKGNGIYEWTGSRLGSNFKFNNGAWDKGWDIGQSGQEFEQKALELGQPFTYVNADGCGNLYFGTSIDWIEEPVVTLDLANETVTVNGKLPIYLMGEMNNNTRNPSYYFLPEGDGFYGLTVASIPAGTTFKIATCNWSTAYIPTDGTYELGDSQELEVEATTTTSGTGYSFDTEMLNVTFTLDLENNELSVEGTPAPSANGDALVLTLGNDKTNQSGTIKGTAINIVTVDAYGEASIYVYAPEGSTIYYKESGGEPPVTSVRGRLLPSSTYQVATKINGTDDYGFAVQGSGSVDLYYTNGSYTSPTYTYTYTVEKADGNKVPTFVESVGVEELGEAVYYNLQGVRVQNPAHGIYVKVQGGKATKVLF